MIISQPYPINNSIKSRWLRSILIGLFVFLFLFIFKPFGIGNIKNNFLFIVFGYSVTSFVVTAFLNVLCMSIFAKFFKESTWTNSKEFLWMIVNVSLIGVANTIYSACINIGNFSLSNLFWFELFTIAIAVFPIAIIILLKQNYLRKKFEHESQSINQQLRHSIVDVSHEFKEQKLVDAQTLNNKIEIEKNIKDNLPFLSTNENENLPINNAAITIPSENGKDNFTIIKDDLLYICSLDNYVEIFYIQNNKVNTKLIRASLKNIADALSTEKDIFRTHKSYVVNLAKVISVSGNAQGYKLHLENIEELIPVSRSLNTIIKDLLTNRTS